MSAYGYKQTSRGLHNYVCLTPESGHSSHDAAWAIFRCPLYPQKRTLERVSPNVRF